MSPKCESPISRQVCDCRLRGRLTMGRVVSVLLALCLASTFATAGGEPPGNYSFLVLGDTHFDAEPSVYHTRYLAMEKPPKFKERSKEFRRNAEMWRERMPRLLASLAAATNASFCIHVGDIIQGDCVDGATQRRMLDDALATIRYNLPAVSGEDAPIPFLPVIGNHDLRLTGGKGDRSGAPLFHAWANPVLEQAATLCGFTPGRMIGSSRLFRREVRENGETWCDWFLFLDYTEKNPVDIVSNAFSDASDIPTRHRFVVCHKPLSRLDPEDHSDTANWLLSGDGEQESHSSLVALCQSLQIVWISGHIHRMAWKRNGGLCEVAVNSVWAKDGQLTFRWNSPTGKSRGNHAVANAAGFCVVEVSSDAVVISFRTPSGEENSRMAVKASRGAP